MEQGDRLLPDNIVATRALVKRMRTRSVLAAAGGGLLFSSVCAGAMYFVGKPAFDIGASLVVWVMTFLFFGMPLTFHWWRRWRSIFHRLDLLEARVRSGDVIYGSQVSFD